MRLRNVLVVVIAFLLGACALFPYDQKLDNLFVKDGVTAQSFDKEHLIFAGITSKKPEWNDGEIAKYSADAGKAISDYRNSMHASKSTNLIDELGKDELLRVQQEFAKNQSLSKETAAKISATSGNPRYIVFTELTGNEIKQIRYESAEVKYKTVNGQSVQDGVRNMENWDSTRNLVISTKVYDLTNSEVVLSGDLSAKKTNSRSNEIKQPTRYSGGFLGNLAGRAMEKVVDKVALSPLGLGSETSSLFPAPPAVDEMVGDSFEAISTIISHMNVKWNRGALCCEYKPQKL